MTTWKCKHCGLCCRNHIQQLEEPLSLEAKKYFEGFRGRVVIDNYHLCFKEKCKHLQQKNGKYYCDDYENRSQFCRDFNETNCKVLHKLKEAGII